MWTDAVSFLPSWEGKCGRIPCQEQERWPLCGQIPCLTAGERIPDLP